MKNLKTTVFLGIASLSLAVIGVCKSHADETVKKFPAGGAKNLLEYPKNPVGDAGGALKLKRDCKTSDGKLVLKGDPAYEACLKEKLEKPKK